MGIFHGTVPSVQHAAVISSRASSQPATTADSINDSFVKGSVGGLVHHDTGNH